jgi:hypothetical protein
MKCNKLRTPLYLEFSARRTEIGVLTREDHLNGIPADPGARAKPGRDNASQNRSILAIPKELALNFCAWTTSRFSLT